MTTKYVAAEKEYQQKYYQQNREKRLAYQRAQPTSRRLGSNAPAA